MTYGAAPIKFEAAPVYGRALKGILNDSIYQYSGLEVLATGKVEFSPTQYLERYRKMPQLEMLAKIGLTKMAVEADENDFVDAKKPWGSLGITKVQFNRLRKINGSKAAIHWMQYETLKNILIDDQDIVYLTDNNILCDDIAFISMKLTVKKIVNYLKKQSRLHGESPKDVLIEWRDYLSMAARQKMLVDEELIYKPKDIKESHDKLVTLCGGVSVAQRAGEIGSMYNDIDDICATLKDKYSYTGKEYSIICPERIEDIIIEGQTLGHCLHKSDIYFDRIHRRETYILFLRKNEDLEKPFYTLEIEPDGTARQKRTVGNKKGDEYGKVIRFLKQYQKQLQKKLTKEDIILSQNSQHLRDQEFAKLREEQTKVWHGELAGRLLADVLEEDLLLATA